MAVIRLQLLIVTPLRLLPFNTLYKKLNTPFADYRSMQYFVEKSQIENLLVNKQMQHHKENVFFFG